MGELQELKILRIFFLQALMKNVLLLYVLYAHCAIVRGADTTGRFTPS